MNDAEEQIDDQQQHAITTPAPAFVQACPGAGKTHVIVSRHLRGQAPALRAGRALVSFTRTARNEMANRCVAEGRSELTQFPHYIGTLDGFIWQFLASSYLPSTQPARLLESWAQLGKANVTLAGRSILLRSFAFTLDPQTVAEDILEPAPNSSEGQLITASKQGWARWKNAVFAARDAWRERGYYTGHESRLQALRNVTDRRARTLDPVLSRFAEVIVDEAQDCSRTDLVLLEALHDHGIPLVVVADPDQSIYRWNQADPEQLRAIGTALGKTIPMTGNRRSAPPICALAATVRHGNRPPDTSVVRTAGPPVHLVPTKFSRGGISAHHTTGQNLVELALETARTHHDALLPPPSVLILGRTHSQLPIALRRAEPASNPLTQLARAHQRMHSGTTVAAELDQACAAAERLLLGYWYPDSTGSVLQICRDVGLPADILRRHAAAFLYALAPATSAEWAPTVNTALKNWWRPPGACPSRGKGRLGGTVAGAGQQHALPSTVRFTTVHQAKGSEADAVCVLLPNDELIDHWLSPGDLGPEDEEELRILYVAVTRARTLLMLAIAPERLDDIDEFLTAHRISTHRVR